MPNIVYVLTNEAMPGLVKIGKSSDGVEARISQLSAATGVPLPFECYYAAEVPDMDRVEKLLHQLFAEYRINPKREFFRVDPEKVVLALGIGAFREVAVGASEIDREEQQALEKAKSRRSRINLEALGIHPGDVLTFSRNSEIIARVVENGKIEFEGEILSLSAAALKILQRLGNDPVAACGSNYWMFEGESLLERRNRMEAEQFDDRPSGSGGP